MPQNTFIYSKTSNMNLKRENYENKNKKEKEEKMSCTKFA